MSERGSAFRKWDLHVHTPESTLNNQFGADWDSYVQHLFRSALEHQIRVIGITDYFSIDGYAKLRDEYLSKPEKMDQLFDETERGQIKRIRLIPNIELRITPIIQTDGDDRKAELHVLFSDRLTPTQIRDNFLHALTFRVEGRPQQAGEERPLTRSNLEELGQRLKREHGEWENKSDYFIGLKCARVDDERVKKLLADKVSLFSGAYLIGLASQKELSEISWDSGSHLVRKVLVQNSDFLFSSNPSTIQWGLGRKGASRDEFRREFNGLKPCLWGSDAHGLDRLFAPDLGRQLWIRSDTTFEGLRQALREPENRIYIGQQEPDTRDRARQARGNRIISSVKFAKVDGAKTSDAWFDGTEVPLNHGLVAIIGNKGTGKSALTDAVALAGGFSSTDDFSFLSDSRFRKAPERLAKDFTVELEWLDGTRTGPISLDGSAGLRLPERVRYLPQKYLERLCAETDLAPFEAELHRVVFDYVPEEKHLGHSDLDSLLGELTEHYRVETDGLRLQLHDVNEELSSEENQQTDDVVSASGAQIRNAREALKAHFVDRPPLPNTPKQRESIESQRLRKAIADLKAQVGETKNRIAEASQTTLALQTAIRELTSLETAAAQFGEKHKPILKKVGIQLRAVITLKSDAGPLRAALSETSSESERLEALISPENSVGFAAQLSVKEAELQDVQATSTAEEGERHNYEQAIRAWRGHRDELQGALDQAHQREREARFLRPSKIRRFRARREAIVRMIWNNLKHVQDEIEGLYSGLDEVIREKDLEANGQLALAVSSGLVDRSGITQIDPLIDHSASAFHGQSEGYRALRTMFLETNFDAVDSCVGLLTSVVERLQGANSPSAIRRQIKGGLVANFYNRLFGLEFIEPAMRLTMDGKDLHVLSPGERGALLLLFYLALDKDTRPLIVDQPEENLDNQSVFEWLVNFIRQARLRRQLLLVTHNPNVAIVTDADQVVYASIERTNGNSVTYQCGSIENEALNRRAVDVLEGTMSAFLDRNGKYEVTRLRY